jgi:uncharacterized protein (TIGR03382 family)
MKLAPLIVLGLSLPASASASWTFDADAEGWGTLNDAQDFMWDGSIGNPAGAIRARDVRDGRIWYYAAPTADLGVVSNLYGGEISWDILGIQGNQTSITNRADVMLVGAGLEIGVVLPVQPVNDTWTSWSVLVDAASGWAHVSSLSSGQFSGTAATEAEIRAVLAGLENLYIRGEFTNGADQTALDNVSFIPTPGSVAVLGLGGLAVSRRRRA